MGNRVNERNHEAIRNEILQSAKSIISDNGVEGLSIRKIAKVMGYSPGSVYHYFKDKDEIIHCIVFEGYRQIITAVKEAFSEKSDPVEALRSGIRAYVESANQYPLEYHAIMTSTHPDIIQYTTVLRLQSFEANPALGMMESNIIEGIEQQYYQPCDTVQMVKMIWSSLYGFTLKTVIETCSDDERHQMTESYIDFLMGQIKRKRPGNV